MVLEANRAITERMIEGRPVAREPLIITTSWNEMI